MCSTSPPKPTPPSFEATATHPAFQSPAWPPGHTVTGRLTASSTMPLNPYIRRRITWCMMTCWLLLADVQATPGSSEARPASRLETSAEQTKKALDQIVTLDLNQHPLSEVVR